MPVPSTVLAPRMFPGVAAINDNEIAIVGGVGENEFQEFEVRGDVVLFNTMSRKAEVKAKSIQGLLTVYRSYFQVLKKTL